MASERVVIEIDTNDKDLDSTIEKLEKVGKVDKKNAEQFKKTSKSNQAAIKQTKSSIGTLSKGVAKLGGAIAGAFAIQQAITSAVKSIVEFEKAMASLSAITGATGKDLDFLKRKALELGASSGLGASQTAKAFELIGSKKPELLKSSAALASVTKQAILLSQAAGIELTNSAESLTSVLNQFNLGAEESARIVNVLAAGSKEGAVAIPEITQAVVQFGAVAASANISVEESVALVEVLGEKGIDAAKSGTALRNILIKLQSGADDTNPAIVGVTTALDNLGKKNLSVTALTKEFGLENVVAAQILTSSADKIITMTEAVTGTNVALEQAAVRNDTIDFKWKRLTSTMEAQTIALNEGTGAMSKFVKASLDGLIELFGPLESITQQFERLGATIGKADDDSLQAQRRRLAAKVEEMAISVREVQEINPLIAKHAQGELEKAKERLRLLDIEIAEVEKLVKLEEKSGKVTAKKKKDLKDINIIHKRTFDDIAKARKEQEAADAKAAAADPFTKLTAQRQKNSKAANDSAAADLADGVVKYKASEEEKQAIAIDSAGTIASAGLQVFGNMQQKQTDIALAGLDARLAAGTISDEAFAAERKRILTEQAKQEKTLALFDIAIATAVAIAQNVGVPPLAIAAGIAGAAQAAVVASTPVPQLRKGGTPLDAAKAQGMLRGASHERGGIMIEAEGNEYLMPVAQSMKYRKELDDMRMGVFNTRTPKVGLISDLLEAFEPMDDQNIVNELKRSRRSNRKGLESLASRLSKGKHVNQRNAWG